MAPVVHKLPAVTLDGGLVNIGDGSVRQRLLSIDSGFATPLWVRDETGRYQYVQSLPWRGMLESGQVELLSSGPTVSQTITVSVEHRAVGSPPAGWRANEPAGMTEDTSREFSAVSESGWSHFSRPNTSATLEVDENAPKSPNNVVRQTYDHPGYADGDDPDLMIRTVATAKPRIYICAYIKWSDSPVWKSHPSYNKTYFVKSLKYSQGGNPLIVGLKGSGDAGTNQYTGLLPVQPRIQGRQAINYDANRGSPGDDNVVRGQWHLIEVVAQLNSTATSTDGVLRVWVDGVLTHEYTDVPYTPFDNDTWQNVKLEPVWGGNSGQVLDADQWLEYDAIYVSLGDAV